MPKDTVPKPHCDFAVTDVEVIPFTVGYDDLRTDDKGPLAVSFTCIFLVPNTLAAVTPGCSRTSAPDGRQPPLPTHRVAARHPLSRHMAKSVTMGQADRERLY